MQKDIGKKKKVCELKRVIGVTDVGLQAKEDASEFMQKKADLEKEKTALESSAAKKDSLLQQRLRTIGNYVHDSVQVSNNEVTISSLFSRPFR